MSVNYTPTALLTMLKTRDRIGVISHYNPDPDAYGSSAALYLYLKQEGKKTWLINQDAGKTDFSWIPGASDAISTWPSDIDTLVVCDCGDRKRIGDELLATVPASVKLWINIDHHSSNDKFGDATMVMPDSSSTCELIYNLISSQSKVSPQVATALLAGIYADTGSFRHTNVKSQTFEVASGLLKSGADHQHICRNLFSSFSLSSVKLQSKALSEMRLLSSGKVAWIVVTPEMIKESEAVLEDAEGLAERARDIDGVLVSGAARFDGEIWRISLRSKSDNYNVSDVAASFGGGGHKAAAAFRSRKPLKEIEDALLEKLTKLVS